MSLVVDAPGERLEVQGFRFADAEGDEDIWRRVWQENDLDAGLGPAHTESLDEGRRLRPRGAAGGWRAVVTIEDPLDRASSRWRDRRERSPPPAGSTTKATRSPTSTSRRGLQVPLAGQGGTGRDERPADRELALETSSVRWTRLEVPDEPWPLPNPLGVVPVAAAQPATAVGSLVVRDRVPVRLDGRSEIAAVMSNQDAINKYRADASWRPSSRRSGSAGRSASTSPSTPRPADPSSPSSRPWTGCGRSRGRTPRTPTSVPAGGRVRGHGPVPYKLMIETEVGHISSISRIPYHFFLGQPQAIPPSGESLKSSEAGLVRKVGRIALHLGEGWEEVMRLCLLAMGDARGRIRSAETIWRDPETQNEAVRTDAVLKQFQAGVIDLESAQEQLGYSPEQVRQMRERRAAEPASVAVPEDVHPDRRRLHRDAVTSTERYHEREHQRDQRPGAGRAAQCGHTTSESTTQAQAAAGTPTSPSRPRRRRRAPARAGRGAAGGGQAPHRPAGGHDAQLSETERLQRRVTELEAEREAIATRERERAIRLAALEAAAVLGFRDPDLAVRLVDPSAVEPERRRDAEERRAPARRSARPLALPRPSGVAPDFGGGQRGRDRRAPT